MTRVGYEDMKSELHRVLLELGFKQERAERCAGLFADASLNGVSSHGLNRFPRFVEMVRRGVVDVHAEPERAAAFGGLERWDGRFGAGNLNAQFCMARAIELSWMHGIGCVALANTNHWMRGGTYGWQAAEAGVVGICWTNTSPNMPAWGAIDSRVGNNPLILAVPRPSGHLVLDTAMSQFSYGALESYRLRNEALPVVGGFDMQGELTQDPAAIEESQRILPTGFWKGYGLSVMLDAAAVLLSGGMATHQVPADPIQESGLSQVFVAFAPSRLYPPNESERILDELVENLRASKPMESTGRTRYPGKRTLSTRQENLERGIPVEPSVWESVRAM